MLEELEQERGALIDNILRTRRQMPDKPSHLMELTALQIAGMESYLAALKFRIRLLEGLDG